MDIVDSKGLKGGPAGLSLGILGVILGGKNRHSFPQKNTHIRVGLLIDSTVYLRGSMGDFSLRFTFKERKGKRQGLFTGGAEYFLCRDSLWDY
jgi:hypothetical protein